MKKIILFLILIFIAAITARKTAQKCNPLTLRCRCSNVAKLVCGVSGKTHVNECVANCFGDKVKHVGACTGQCSNSTRKCQYLPYGHDGGKRKRCCNNLKVCFGKTCTQKDGDCKWVGGIIKKVNKAHCYWKKRGKASYQRICCRWKKICKGSCKKGSRRCYLTRKHCKFTGRVIKTKHHRACSYHNLEHGKRKRCCTYYTKCLNKGNSFCKNKATPRCWTKQRCSYEGPYLKRKCSTKCQNVPVGRHGRRRRCCKKCRTCKSYKYTQYPKRAKTTCQVTFARCKWKGPVVIIRDHRKCKVKPYGINKNRKRCCRWRVKCQHKHCKVVRRRCYWKGCVVKNTKHTVCRMKMKNNIQKQRFCCVFNKRCCDGKCKTYNNKCRWVGKIITTKYHWRCTIRKVGKYGRRKQCCRHRKSCSGGKCSSKRLKCEWRGCLKVNRPMIKCSIKKFTKNFKCRRCCKFRKVCDCGVCRHVRTRCKCVKKFTVSHFDKCVRRRRNKFIVQSRCCRFKRWCVDKKCKVRKVGCRWSGEQIVTRIKRRCFMRKIGKNKRRRYCCKHTRKCFGFKCKNSRRVCSFVGLIYTITKVHRCKTFRLRRKGATRRTRRKCCVWKRYCRGTICKRRFKKCRWTGKTKKVRRYSRTVFRRVKKFCHRRYKCTWRRKCLGVVCKVTKKRCSFRGPVICRYRRTKFSWIKRGHCKRRRICSFNTVCKDSKCHTFNRRCRNVGKKVCVRKSRRCKWTLYNGTCERRRCCKRTRKCFGKKRCSTVVSSCKWKGIMRCHKHSIKCSLRKYNKGKRTRCCKTRKTCYNKKCRTRNVWCKWRGGVHIVRKYKRCIMVPLKSNKYILIKRKRCTYWDRYCVSGRGCKRTRVVHKWKGRKIIIRRFRRCQLRNLNKKYQKTHCCRFLQICKGKKCKNYHKGCFWSGRRIRIKLSIITRWKTICRDTVFGKRKGNRPNIRLNCCRVKQRCFRRGSEFTCTNIRRSKCWWRGSIRGDVWIQDQQGKWTEVNAVGSFRYLEDKEKHITVDTQFTKSGEGSVTTGIVFSNGKHTVNAEEGKVFVNGKEVTTDKKVLILYKKDKIKVIKIKGHAGNVVVKGAVGDTLRFRWNKKAKAYKLSVTTKELSRGLYTDPEHPKKYQLTKGQSKFAKYVEFELLKSKEGNEKQRKEAMECCHLSSTEQRLHQCMSDFIKTGKCFADDYKGKQIHESVL